MLFITDVGMVLDGIVVLADYDFDTL